MSGTSCRRPNSEPTLTLIVSLLTHRKHGGGAIDGNRRTGVDSGGEEGRKWCGRPKGVREWEERQWPDNRLWRNLGGIIHVENESAAQVMRDFMVREIEVIQHIIERMASNSFLIKGWTVTLVVVTLLLKGDWYEAFIGFVPLMAFWVLDAYFLRQERMYRKLYDWVRNNRPNTDEHLFDMNAGRFQQEVASMLRLMFSLTLGVFYGTMGAVIVAYIVLTVIVQRGGS